MKNRLKRYLALLLAVILVLPDVAIGSLSSHAQALNELDTKGSSAEVNLTQSMEVGDTVFVNGYSTRDEWSVDSTGIVSLGSETQGRTVTALSPGKAVVTKNFYWTLLTGYTRSSSYTFTVMPKLTVPASYSILKGQTADLNSLVSAESGTTLVYATSNSSVASISGSTLTAQGTGTSTISVTAEANGIKNVKTFTLTVTIGVEASDMTVYEGQTVDYAAVSYPSGYVISYTADDSGVISCADGRITALKQGSAVLTASITEGGKTYTDTAVITVVSNVKDFTVAPSELTVYVGCRSLFTASMEYWAENGKKDYSPVWEVADGGANILTEAGSSGAEIAVTGRNEGSASLKLSAGGCSKTVTVEVKDVSFAFPDGSVSLYIGGESKTLVPYSTPASLDSKYTVTYTMADPTIAKVDANGKVTGLKAGSTVLYAVVSYYGKTYGDSIYESEKISTAIYVNSNVRSVEFTDGLPGNGTELSDVFLYEGSVSTFRAVVRRLEALSTNHEISFSSSDTSVVQVAGSQGSGDAVVTAVSRGIADITAESEGQKAVAHVTVVSNISQVRLSETMTLNKGTTSDLTDGLVDYYDSENGRLLATSQDGGYPVSFRSSDSSVVTVSSSGILSAVGTGTATVTVSVDGNLYYSVVTVKETFESVSFSPAEAVIDLAEGQTLDALAELQVSYYQNDELVTVPYESYPGTISLKWYSMNSDVASVDANGVITAKSVGYATINVQADNFYANLFVRVKNGSTEPSAFRNVTYRVVIHYVYGSDCGELAGKSAADDWSGTYLEGDEVTLNVDSPSGIVGYRADISVYKEEILHLTSGIERTVVYHPGPVTFTVKYFRETEVEGTYEQYGEAVQLTGVTGERVGLYSTSFDNRSNTDAFKSYTKVSYNRDTKLAADSSTVVAIYYKRKSYTVRFNLNGGSGTDPVYAPFGTKVKADTPTRDGYEFAGWYADEELTTAVDLSSVTVPEYNVTYYAKWSPKSDTTYRVLHWLENADSDTYSIATVDGVAVIDYMTGTTGTATAAVKRSFTNYDGSGTSAVAVQQKTISGDGMTIVNVYYKRNVYSIYFKNGSTTLTDLTITSKWGQNISDSWPSNTSGGNRWATSNGGNHYQTNIDVMPVGGKTFYVPSSGSTKYTAYYYVEALAGTTTSLTDKNGNYVELHHTDVTTGPSGLSVDDNDKYAMTGFTYSYYTSGSYGYNGAKFYYTRNQHTITYHSNFGTDASKSVTAQYGADLSAAVYSEVLPESRTGYLFKGWYTDATCQIPYDFNTTMPDYDLILFAKWEPTKVVLTVISENISNESHSVMFEGLRDFIPTEHESWDDSALASWEAVGKNESDTREFVGWFKDTEDGPVPFTFENGIHEDTTVRARFRDNLIVDVKIHYVGENSTGTETLSEDTADSSFQGDSVTYSAKVIGDHWYPKTNSHTLLLTPDGAAEDGEVTYTAVPSEDVYLYEYTFEYVQRESVGYTVRYIDQETGAPLHDPVTGTTTENVILLTALNIEGYNATERMKSFILTANDEDNVITFYYTESNGTTAPVAVYYWLAKPGTDPVVYQETPYLALCTDEAIGSLFSYEPLAVTGYAFDHADAAETVTVTSGGLTINLYYTCSSAFSYTVKYVDYYDETKSVKAPKLVENQTYGTSIREEAPEIPGYRLVSASPQTLQIDSNNENNLIVFKYIEKTVNISYVSLTTGCGVSNTQDTELKAVTGVPQGSVAEITDGYTFVGWFSDPAGTDLISEEREFVPAKTDGVYVSATYYAKWKRTSLSYTARYLLNGTSFAIAETSSGTVYSGDSVEPAVISGYEAVTGSVRVTEKDQVLTYYYRKIVTLTANSGSFLYDGTEKTVSGFSVKSGGEIDGYPADFDYENESLRISASGSGTAVGSYEVVFAQNAVGRVDESGCYVVGAVEKGTLSVRKNDTAIDVYVTGTQVSTVYTGSVCYANGFSVTAVDGSEGTGFASGMVSFVSTENCSNTEASGTDAGTYVMGLTADNFVCGDANYTNVAFHVTDGSLTVTPRQVTLTSGSYTGVYDGASHTVKSVEASGEGFVSGQNVTVSFPGSSSVTHVSEGTVENRFTWVAREGTNLSNYDITPVYGTLSVSPVTAAIAVKITGNTLTAEYDEAEHSVSGFTLKAEALNEEDQDAAELYDLSCMDLADGKKAEAKGTDAGQYPMNLTPEHFVNISEDFSSVSFEIEKDGLLTISTSPIIIEDISIVPAEGEDQVEGVDFKLTASIEEAQDEDASIEVLMNGSAAGTLTISAGETEGELTVANPNTEDVYTDASTVVFSFTGLEGTNKAAVVPAELSSKSIQVSDTIDQTLVTLTSKKSFITGDEDAVITVTLSNAPMSGNDATVNVRVGSITYPVVIAAGQKSAELTVAKPFDGENTGSIAAEVTSVTGGKFEQVSFADASAETRLEVVVTITGTVLSAVYNGELQTAEGYTFTVNNAQYTAADFGLKEGCSAKAEGRLAAAAPYQMGLTADSFENLNEEYDGHVAFAVTDGALTITKKAVSGMTITADSAEKVYDGTALTAPGASVTAGVLADGDGLTVVTRGSQTAAGSSENVIESYSISRMIGGVKTDVTNCYGTFALAAGTLTVTDNTDEIVISVTGNTCSGTYNGSEYSVSGYEVSIPEKYQTLLSKFDFSYSGSTALQAADAGTYYMGLDAELFTNTNTNFRNVTFSVVSDGKLEIAKAEVTLTSAGGEREYNGEPLTQSAVTAVGFADGEGVSEYNVTGSRTDAGSSKNTFTYVLKDNTKAANYDITVVEGDLTVKPVSSEVTVTITGNTDTVTYDGAEHTVEGFSFEADNALYTESCLSYKGTAADKKASARYAGTCQMALSAELFENVSGNFASVSIRVENGWLKINPRTADGMSISSESASKEYDGTALTNGSFTVTPGVLAEGDVLTAVVSGSQTAAGSSKNTVSSYKIMRGSVDVTDCYGEFGIHEGELTVEQKKIVISVKPAAKVYGSDDPVFSYELLTADGEPAELVNEGDLGTITVRRDDQEGTSPEATGTHKLTADYTPNSNYEVRVESADFEITKNTGLSLTLTDDTEGKDLALGQTVHYEAVVKNTGDVPITVTLTDSLTGVSESFTLLPGATRTVEAQWTVSEADIIRGSVTEAFNASAVDPEGDALIPATGQVTSNTGALNGTLTVTKNAAYPAGKRSLSAGDVVSYTITVANTGNVTVSGITLTDALLGYESEAFSLAPQTSVTLPEEGTLSYTVAEADLLNGSIVNTAAAEGSCPVQGTDGDTQKVSAEGQVTVQTDEPEGKLSVTKTSDLGAGEKAKAGQTVHYTITVTNTGNIAVSGITVTDPMTGLTESVSDSLGTGSFVSFETEYVITEKDLVNGSVVNTAYVSGTGADLSEVNASGECTVYTEEIRNTLTVKKTADKTENVKAGETVTYQFEVVNEGNVTIQNIVVTDARINYVSAAFVLAPGEKNTLTAFYTVTEADLAAGSVENTVTVTGTDPKQEQTEALGSCTVDTEDVTRTLTLEKKITNREAGEKVSVGDVLQYEITVTNSGNLTVRNVTVVDAMLGITKKIDSISPTASEKLTGSYVVTEKDVRNGSITNTAGAAGTSSDGQPAEAAAASVTIETVPADRTLTVEKTSDTEGTVSLGQEIHYTITVTNTGNQTAYGVTVLDSLTSESWDAGTMAPGQISVYSASYTVTEEDIMAGSVVNTAAAAGEDKDGNPTTGGEDTLELITDPAAGALSFTKSDNIDEGHTVTLDDKIVYTFTVENTGNITVSDITVTDGRLGYTSEAFELAPGAVKSLSAEYTVTEADVLAGSVYNTAAASGTDRKDQPVETSAENSVPTSDQNRNLTLVKTSDVLAGEKAVLGQLITYTITVTNSGNLTANKVAVIDELTGFSAEIASLAPKESEQFTTTYTVTEKDIENGSVTNTAAAAGKTSDGESTTGGTGSCTVETETAVYELSLVKTSNLEEGETAKLGQTVYYTITVTNIGNQTLSDITVTDELTGFSESGITLAPGKSAEFKTEYLVTEADILAGSVTNSAGAEGVGPNGTESTGGEGECTVPTEEKTRTLTLTKESDVQSGEKAEAGRIITYTIIVKNDGNLTASDIVMTDEKLGFTSEKFTLAPGASEKFILQYTVTEADIRNGSVVNTALASGVNPDGESTEGGSDGNTVETVPADRTLTVVKTADTEGPVNAGDTIVYTIRVANDGNQTAYGVLVADALTGGSWTIESLAPGMAESFETSYTVTEADLIAGHVLNTVTAAGEDADGQETTGGEAEKDIETVEISGGLAFRKTSDRNEGETVNVGDVVTYYLTVTNQSNATVRNIVITDEKLGYESESFALASGASRTVDVTYTVTAKDVLAGSVTNSAAVSGELPNGSELSGSDELTLTASAIDRNLIVVKRSDKEEGEKAALGETIEYTITVTNPGSMDVTDVLVTDEKTGLTRTFDTIPAGSSVVAYTSYIVTEDDIAAGEVLNTAVAVGTAADGEPTTGGVGTDTVPTVDKDRTLTVTKTSDVEEGEKAVLGQEIHYTITVTNSGNMTASGITVTDEKTGFSAEIEELAPNASESFETSLIVSEADILAGSVLNVATASGTSKDGEPTDSDPGENEVPTEELNKTLSVVKEADRTEGVNAGDTVTYTITVTNSGNLTARDVLVTDELTGFEQTIASLAPGSSESFSTAYTVTDEDVEAGYVKNVATAKGMTDGGETDGGEGEKEIHPVTKDRTLTVTKTSDVEEGEKVSLGQLITYTITVTNSGNVAAYQAAVTDALTGLSETIEKLDVGESKSFTTTYTVTEADIRAGSIENHATAKGTDKSGESTIGGEGVDKQTTEEKNTHLTVTKSSDAAGKKASLGQLITYTITVTNDGNQTVRNIEVTDALTGLRETITALLPGEKRSLTTTYTVTEADVLRGSVLNTAAAKGTDDGGDENGGGEGENTVETETKRAVLTLTKTSDVGSNAKASLGQVITYTIVVRNTGNVTAYNVTVTDALTGLSENIDALLPGEAKSFITKYTVKQSDILKGSVTNHAAAKGTDAEGGETEDGEGDNTVPVEEKSSKITVTKTSDVGNGEKVAEGRVITYTILVRNDGNVTVRNITVTDELTGFTKSGITLSPGEQQSCTTTYTVTAEDVAKGSIVNHAAAKGTDPEGQDSEDGEGQNTVETTEGTAYLTVKKEADTLPGEKVSLGDTITYTITVTNTGNLTAKNVTVTDAKTGMKESIASLASGASKSYTTVYTVQEEDIVEGRVMNHVTARGTDTNGNGTEGGNAENEVLTEELDNTIVMKKTADVKNGAKVSIGDKISYTLTVSNEGNVTVKNIRVSDGLTEFEDTIGELKPGETESFTTAYVVSEEDAATGRVLNVAVAEGQAPDGKRTESEDGESHVSGTDEVEVEVTDEPAEEPETEEPRTEEPGTESEPSEEEAYDIGTEAEENAKEYDPDSEELNPDGTPRARGNGFWALLNLILTALTALTSLLLLMVMKRRQAKASGTSYSAGQQDHAEDEELEKNRKLWRYFSVFVSSAAIVTFILTEDVTQKMRLTDRYTVLMVIIALVQIVIALLARRKKENYDQQNSYYDDEEVTG